MHKLVAPKDLYLGSKYDSSYATFTPTLAYLWYLVVSYDTPSLYSSECVVVSTYFFMAFIKKQSYRRVHVARLPQFQIFSLAQSPDSLSGSLLAYS